MCCYQMKNDHPRIRQIDLTQSPPQHLTEDDIVYCLREYTSGGGFHVSKTNQLVMNLKKPVDRKDYPEYQYKELAIQQMAKEMKSVFSRNNELTIVPIPPSCQREDPLYDDRMWQVATTIAQESPIIRPMNVFDCVNSTMPTHLGGIRSVAHLQENYVVRQIPQTAIIVLIDDVITTGAHYKACKNLISGVCPFARVYGVFWALSRW